MKSALAEQRCLVFLDAHFPGADYGGKSYNDASHSPPTRLPLIDELALLKGRAANALIVIDDVRIYRRGFQVAHGPLPDAVAHGFDQEARLLALLAEFEATHALRWLSEDTGYAVLWPRAWGDYDLSAWVLPGDITQPFVLQMDVPGTTCISLNRRLQDARFSNRWLAGVGIDIGGGPDSIAVYAQLFPRIQAVTVYDMPQGDAQYLANVPDEAFDFAYSGHCLEHMVDPRIALRNWLRVVKPGGHLVITVPDEDLYEQGVWPSTFNLDHKHTFTMFKRTSWSPVSINVLDLLREFDGEVNVQKVERLDHAFLRGVQRFDQTRTAFSECGIELVVQKL
ncbi:MULTISPECIES: class I SAM-dependent methyltransferase [unclassified Caballeronia]|uniref:class I SAM-dependent methyltransferase n=1 Tax=unclassified Caballeronia TaxID=2646786 RepID=UPI0028617421|nr:MULTISPECIES: class I SAM-dependent methyltransferase [unclassified Caballeronia]MDR5736668.1 class I SAM-dependent methyltransferase [Caballeronia sp. LZ016]MDR5810851.1 class I SAM-dependent methyltransferase [Caballeronia sp. LZ019]